MSIEPDRKPGELQQRLIDLERGHPPHSERPRTMSAVILQMMLCMAEVIEQQGRQIAELQRRAEG